jgi:pimeloyl-ACP methyl ester carboxylesterase
MSLPNVVLVHGAWADGSCWSSVIERLQADGYHVTAPQFPMTTLDDDVARLRQVLAVQDGPAIVAGHSYGGQIMTALGTGAPNVAGLVYIAAFGIDEGESLGGLLARGPVTPALQHLITDEQGFTWLSEDDFVNHFAADVDPVRARVMYAVQQALAASSFGNVMGVPAWKSQPTWYLVAAPRRGDPAGRRAPVRRAHGCCHRRDPVQPRGDGVPPGRRGAAHRDRRQGGLGRRLSYPAAVPLVRWPSAAR